MVSLALFALLSVAVAAPSPVKRQDRESWTPENYGTWADHKDGASLEIETWAYPSAVVNASNAFTGGLPNAAGYYHFLLNSDEDVICYWIQLWNFPQGDDLVYQSPAATATHIHQSEPGQSGPPRIAFPNPAYNDAGDLISKGCMKGPFTTGLVNNGTGQDNGAGFTIAQLVEKPNAFNADVHTSTAVAGAVRGQLHPVKYWNKCN